MFNTLGDFVVIPRAGLLFVDFDHNRILQLSGRTELLCHLDERAEETGGIERYSTLEIARWIETDLPAMHGRELLEYSPFNPEPEKNETDRNRQPAPGGPASHPGERATPAP